MMIMTILKLSEKVVLCVVGGVVCFLVNGGLMSRWSDDWLLVID